jgi:hypothetical protein
MGYHVFFRRIIVSACIAKCDAPTSPSKGEVMIRFFLGAASVALIASTAVHAQNTDKAKAWCNDAHMKKMDDAVAKISDPSKKQAAMTALDASKAAMKKKDMAGCVKSMMEAHKAMGL